MDDAYARADDIDRRILGSVPVHAQEKLMAHRTFFSFHYDDDVWRATNVRNCGALNKGDAEFIDASL